METRSTHAMELLEERRRPITVDEYRAMARAGILRPDDRVELIDGRIVSMSPIGWAHANVVVADTTATFDRRLKLPRYARSGIAVVWIVEVGARCVEVYSDPQGDTYRERIVMPASSP